jgi:hypothetical protein
MKSFSPGVLAAVVSTLLPALLLCQVPDELRRKLDEAERHIVRLPPTAFPELPRNVVRELQRRGCRIPQEAFTKKQRNVIKGHFARPGEWDWAVLCSVKGLSTILVFRNGSEKNPAAIAPSEDRNYLQGITADEIGYSRDISPVGRDSIVAHFDAYGGPKPPPIDHQGIDDAFAEKGSVTWYFHAGKWLQLTGSD